MKHPLTEQRFQAIIENNSKFDGNFYYGVKTTHIFCKPSCPSKVPNRKNIQIFKNVNEALTAGFRPCKRCQPTNTKLPNDAWVEQIKMYLQNNFQQKLDLETIATDCHGSVSNLQRTFKSITGQSPNDYLNELRLQYSLNLLKKTDYSIKTIAFRSGFNSDTYFNTKFKQRFHSSPLKYRSK